MIDNGKRGMKNNNQAIKKIEYGCRPRPEKQKEEVNGTL